MPCSKSLNGCCKIVLARKTCSVQCFSRQDAKPDFHLIEPARWCWNKMKMYSLFIVLFQPFVVLLMSTIIIQNHINLFVVGQSVNNTAKKCLEIFSLFLLSYLGVYMAGAHIQRRKQIKGSVVLVRTFITAVYFFISGFNETGFSFNRLNAWLFINT